MLVCHLTVVWLVNNEHNSFYVYKVPPFFELRLEELIARILPVYPPYSLSCFCLVRIEVRHERDQITIITPLHLLQAIIFCSHLVSIPRAG